HAWTWSGWGWPCAPQHSPSRGSCGTPACESSLDQRALEATTVLVGLVEEVLPVDVAGGQTPAHERLQCRIDHRRRTAQVPSAADQSLVVGRDDVGDHAVGVLVRVVTGGLDLLGGLVGEAGAVGKVVVLLLQLPEDVHVIQVGA